MLQIKNIKKEYKTGDLVQKALDDVSLNLRDNEFVAVLGPSGSGKTTLLNIIGGLDRYDSGDLIINNMSTKKYSDRDWDSYRNHTIGFIFQSYNLIPHQTILSNVELALTISGVSRKERKKRAKKALEEVGLGEQIHKRPNQLSGGQMQRVAIARALVNNPDIVLADEPTGALDTDTGIQVMELLKKVAKDRLVVMVTHNPDLAEKYATRIVRLQDGRITGDSEPFDIDENAVSAPVHETMGKVSMSFGKSLSLSFNNLRTKKGRTFLTAFAGSIGIIGIALILAISDGVNGYIQSIQEDTMAEYPLQITTSGFDIASMMSSGGPMGLMQSANEGQDEDGEINVTHMINTMFTTVSTNDLEYLKKYLDSGESDIDEYTKAIEYQYDIEPQIYRIDGNSYRQVNPDNSFNLQGQGILSRIASGGTNEFYKMPANSDLYESQYDIKAGRWPENYNECVLVLTSQGTISDLMLYTLGLRDYSEIDKMVEQYNKGEEVETIDYVGSYSYDDVIGTKYKLVNSSDYYEFDSSYNVWTDKTENQKYMYNLVKNAEDIEIVGVVQPSENATSQPLTSGINYPASLITHIVEEASESEIVQYQMDHPTVNIFTNEEFGDDTAEIDMSSLFNIDEDALSSSFDMSSLMDGIDFSFDMSDMAGTDNMAMPTSLTDGFDLSLDALDLNSLGSSMDLSSMNLAGSFDMSNMDFAGSLDMSSLNLADSLNMSSLDLSSMMDMSDMEIDMQDMDLSGVEMPEMDMTAILENIDISFSTEGMNEMISALFAGYQDYLNENPIDFTPLANDFTAYLSSDESQKILTDFMTEMIQNSDAFSVDTDSASDLLRSILEDYQQFFFDNYNGEGGATIDSYLASNRAQSILNDWIGENISFDSFSIDSDALGTLSESLVSSYITWAEENNSTAFTDLFSGFTDYFESDSAREIISAGIAGMIDMSSIESQIASAMQSYMASVMASYSSAISSAMEAQIETISVEIAKQMSDSISNSMAEVMSSYTETIMSGIESSISDYMTGISDSMSDMMQSYISTISDSISTMMENSMQNMSSSMQQMMTSTVQNMTGTMQQTMESYMQNITNAIQQMMTSYTDGISNAINLDPDSLSDSVDFNFDGDSLTDLITSMYSSSGSGYDNNLATLGYVDFDSPSEIDIYPTDFESKEFVTDILDNYNKQMEENGEDEKVITYTDLVGTMMSAVTTIINVVSYVLIAFVAVSLIVSSIMIGIITYISVLERTKEIGILRAMGASKRNISQIFNAETFIIGLFAGLLGVIITMLLCIPINAILAIVIGDASVTASLPLTYGGILVLLSMFLTIISGLIPSRKAAQKDPVTALRTE